MRIALIHYTAAPVVGGVERVMDEHARLFAAHGHDVMVFCGRGGDGNAVPVPRGKPADVQAAALGPLLAGREIVFVHNVMTMPFDPGLTEALARLAGELPRVRFVAWTHDVAAGNPDYRNVPPLIRTMHPRFEHVAVSPLRARALRDAMGGLESPCRVIPNGLDPARVLGLPASVAEFARRHRLLDGRLVLLHPARVISRKGIETSLGVAREFGRRRIPAIVLVTAAPDPHGSGDGRLLGALRRRFRTGRNHFFVSDHFAIGDAELAGLYSLADALLFPSLREGFGLPLIEAALRRLPVYCSDIDPLRDLLAENVRLFPPGEKAPRIATLIRETLEASPAHRERKRMLREFSWEAIYRKHLAPMLRSREG